MIQRQNQSELRLDGYEVVLCLSGGVACYKSATLASRLVQAGAGVSVAMSEAAERFVTPLTFQALTHRQVFTSLWQSGEDFRSRHTSLADLADIIVVAPATADIMAKMAAGIADGLVPTTILAATGACPILIAPGMNTRMWESPATQSNVARLKEWGFNFIGPAEGNLACGTVGIGRVVEPEEILATIADILKQNPPKNAATT
ncbi:MAG: hypothetical protein K8S55_05290 [Phycisphaerae bacterium]|nr:hypothetical protein [Phycisphaerae bacterium]